MKKTLLSLFFLCLLSLAAADDLLPAVPWFDHVKQPSSLTHEQLCDLAKQLHAALKARQTVQQMAALMPDDPTPRVVFITIGDDDWPGRTFYGAGFTFRTALEAAISIYYGNQEAYARETVKFVKSSIADAKKAKRAVPKAWLTRVDNPCAWSWLRLDVVQATRPTPNFNVERSRIAQTSLVGFAFGPDVGFAFTPDQITGRCLLTDSRHIAKQQVANIISEAYNWPALQNWIKFSAVDVGHRICLFETDSFYSNGVTTCRLYRGHRLFNSPPNGRGCLALASACADKLLAAMKTDGAFPPPIPCWVSTQAAPPQAARKKKAKEDVIQDPSLQQDEELDVKAELAIALIRLSKATGQPKYANAALTALLPAIKAVRKTQDGAMVVTEPELLPKDSMLTPQKVIYLRTNALVCIALRELPNTVPNRPENLPQIAQDIAATIATLKTDDDDFHEGRYLKDGKILTASERSRYEQVEDSALAILALAAADPQKYGDIIMKSIANLYEQRVVKAKMETLVLSPWLVEAFALKKRPGIAYVKKLMVLGYAASSKATTTPLDPDYFGAIPHTPSCTLAAENTWLLANLSRYFRDLDKQSLAAEQLSDALPQILFQVNAYIDGPSSSLLPEPQAYQGYFRDNLENYGFDLPGQVAQILSMVALSGELDALQSKLLTDKFLTDLLKARKDSDSHPGPLTVELISNSKFDAGEDQRDLSGGLDRAKTKTTRFRRKARTNTPAPRK